MRLLSRLFRDVNEKTLDNNLLKNSKEGNYKEAEKYVKKGANVNVKCDEGNTALMWASYSGHLNIVKLFVKHGADVNAKNNAGYTALMLARAMGHTEISKLLKKYGSGD